MRSVSLYKSAPDFHRLELNVLHRLYRSPIYRNILLCTWWLFLQCRTPSTFYSLKGATGTLSYNRFYNKQYNFNLKKDSFRFSINSNTVSGKYLGNLQGENFVFRITNNFMQKLYDINTILKYIITIPKACRNVYLFLFPACFKNAVVTSLIKKLSL